MLDVNPQIVHFCGHGAGDEGLVLEDQVGQSKPVSGPALAGLFRLFSDQVSCVLLNACHSQFQAEAIARQIPHVIGMTQEIGDRMDVEYAIAFYKALGAGRTVQFAHDLGCNAIELEGLSGSLIPVLLQQDVPETESANGAFAEREVEQVDKDRLTGYQPVDSEASPLNNGFENTIGLREEMLQATLKNWQDRLASLEYDRSMTSDGNKKIDLRMQIEECKKEIQIAEKNITSNLTNTKIRRAFHHSQDLTEETISVDTDSSDTNPSPYAQRLFEWKKSNAQDKSQLLVGEELRSTLERLGDNGLEIDESENFYFIESLIWDAQRPEINSLKHFSWVGNESLLKPPFSKVMKAWFSSEPKNRSSVCSFDFFEGALNWASDNDVTDREHDFIIDIIIEKMGNSQPELEEEKIEVSAFAKKNWQNLKDKAENPYITFKEILAWTDCHLFLTQKLFEVISESESIILKGEESEKISLIVEKYFNNNSVHQEIAQHFQEIHSLLVENPKYDPFWLLFNYRKVLQQTEIQESSLEGDREGVMLLQESNFVVNTNGKLRVRNRLHQAVLNEEWAERNIVFSRPYARKFLCWLDSQCEDNDKLLNKQEVQDAMLWVQNNNSTLSNSENKFLAYSKLEI